MHGRGSLPAGTETAGRRPWQGRSGVGFRAGPAPLKNRFFTVALQKVRAYTARPF